MKARNHSVQLILAVGLFPVLLLLVGCFDSGTSPRSKRAFSVDPVLKLRVGMAGLKSLAKSSDISLDKLVIVLSSSANDTIRDTLTSLTTPALNPLSTNPQTIAKPYALKALRTWKVVVTSRDVLDSVIHRDSALIPVLYAGDTAVANLNLSARYSMYAATFLSIPDSISSASGTHKQKLNIDRLVLKINGTVERDSAPDPGPYFASGIPYVLDYDYVPTGTAGGWGLVSSGTMQDLYSVAFSGPDTGFAVGDNMTLRTLDGGKTWGVRDHAPLIMRAGFVVNGLTAYGAGDMGLVSSTHTGGEDGNAQFLPEPDFPEAADNPSLNTLFFTSASTGYAAGDGGAIWKTTDSSNAWVAQTSGTSQHLRSAHFADAATGWMAGDGGVILKTTNGGTDWAAQTSGTANGLNGVHFVDAGNGWAVGAAGTILKTTNGGADWTPQASGVSHHLRTVYFLDASTGYAAGDSGTLLKTLNGGSTWTREFTGITHRLRSLRFSGPRGYAVGDAGTVLSLVPGNVLIEMQAYGPMGSWNTAEPLYQGAKVISTLAGQDSTVSLTLNWVGPATGAGSLEVEVGKVGKITIDGTVPDVVTP